MIIFDEVSVTYPEGLVPAVRNVTCRVAEGELALVVGPTGAGKSTLLGAACGRVPHFSGGLLEGRVLVQGRDTRHHLPRDLADVVGVVGQDPVRSFVTDTVEEELAYGMEQLGVAPAVMRRRVEEVLDLLGLAALRRRPLLDLSGGEQQRVAIGAVLTAQPRVLVLDEPTSALDPTAAEEVLAAITRLVHDLGVTVLLAEHRLERVVQYADVVVAIDDDGAVSVGRPAAVLAASTVVPPIVDLGRLAGWDPVPLSVRDARRLAGPLRARLGLAAPPSPNPPPANPPRAGGVGGAWGAGGAAGAVVLSARGLRVDYGRVAAVRGVDLDLRAGEVAALMGRNGSGKSSLLWALAGHAARSGGAVRLAAGDALDGARDPAAMRPARARRHVALVPQSPSDLLYLDSVDAECDSADAQAGAPTGTARSVLDSLAPGIGHATHPRDLSEGQRLALALAVQLSGLPTVLLLDEPTRGLDYAAKARLARTLADLAGRGCAVLLSSHDVEFVAGCASRVVVLADGEVVADDGARAVLHGSPTFAPQVARILFPLPFLTVGDVREALDRASSRGAVARAGDD